MTNETIRALLGVVLGAGVMGWCIYCWETTEVAGWKICLMYAILVAIGATGITWLIP